MGAIKFTLRQSFVLENLLRLLTSQMPLPSLANYNHYCQYPACKALDEKEESKQGTLLTFINQLADAVKEEFPDKYIITFAYHYTDNPPKTIRPRDNVAIFLCTFCPSHLHSYEKYGLSCCYYKKGQPGGLVEAIKLWSEMTKNVFVWEYSGDIGHLLRPFPNFRVMKTNMNGFPFRYSQ